MASLLTALTYGNLALSTAVSIDFICLAFHNHLQFLLVLRALVDESTGQRQIAVL